MDEIMLEGKGFSFCYKDSKTDGIQDFNFRIQKGETVLITGDSGCGKSTFIKCVNGLIPEVIEGDFHGDLWVDGKQTLRIDERNHIIGSVFQNPRSQFFTTNTTAEIVFPMENYGCSVEEMNRALDSITEEFRIDNLLNRDVFELSSGERQVLALAASRVLNPKLILFDEPSANLDYCNAMKLKKVIRDFKKKGITVLVADHRFFYLNDLIDKVFLIRKGKLQIYNSEREFKESGYHTRSFDLFGMDIPFSNPDPKELVYEFEHIGYKDILKDVSMEFHKNEVTAIIGNNGVGKTTLARLISGVLKPTSGEMGNSKALYIMQDADFQLFGTSVYHELKLSSDDDALIERVLKFLDLYEFRQKHPSALSGGQKQRLQIAIAIVSSNDLVIFDEPTSGLDLTSMKRVSEQISELKKEKAIAVISHDYEFIRNVSDRIVYLKKGEIKENFALNKDTIGLLNGIFKEMEED